MRLTSRDAAFEAVLQLAGRLAAVFRHLDAKLADVGGGVSLPAFPFFLHLVGGGLIPYRIELLGQLGLLLGRQNGLFPLCQLLMQADRKGMELLHHRQRMQENLLPYKGVLLSLLPIFKKGNVDAFSKKMALLFDMKRYKPLTSSKGMYDTYFELIEKSYHNLITPYYYEHYFKRNVKPLSDYLNGASSADIKAIKEKLDESGKISAWYENEAIPYIAEAMNKIQKLIPAMIYSSVGESDVAKRGNLKIVTISCEEVVSMYSKGFETYTHALKIMVGLNNIVENGNIDRLSGGKMLEHLEDYATIYDYLDGAMNNKVRNAASHGEGGLEYVVLTQEVKCYYDDSDRSKHYDTSLIAICRICYVQLLHILEVTLLARKIVEKVN